MRSWRAGRHVTGSSACPIGISAHRSAGARRLQRREEDVIVVVAQSPQTQAGSGVLGSLTRLGARSDLRDLLLGEGSLEEVDLLFWVSEEAGLS